MLDWNRNMDEAPADEPCWIYVPAYDYVHGSIAVAEFYDDAWHFGEWEVRNGEISDEEGSEGEMIGPQAWIAIPRPNEPSFADS